MKSDAPLHRCVCCWQSAWRRCVPGIACRSNLLSTPPRTPVRGAPTVGWMTQCGCHTGQRNAYSSRAGTRPSAEPRAGGQTRRVCGQTQTGSVDVSAASSCRCGPSQATVVAKVRRSRNGCTFKIRRVNRLVAATHSAGPTPHSAQSCVAVHQPAASCVCSTDLWLLALFGREHQLALHPPPVDSMLV